MSQSGPHLDKKRRVLRTSIMIKFQIQIQFVMTLRGCSETLPEKGISEKKVQNLIAMDSLEKHANKVLQDDIRAKTEEAAFVCGVTVGWQWGGR